MEAFEAWRTSPGHDVNMLDAKQKVIGIARIHDPDSYYGWYWTTDFVSELDSTSHAPGESPSEQGAFRNEQDQVQKPERGRQGPSNAGVGRNEDRVGIENGSMEKDGVWSKRLRRRATIS